MKLHTWMDREGWSAQRLAEALGKSRQAIYGYLSGDFAPDAQAALAIEELSEGSVEASGWLRGLHAKYRVTKRNGSTEPDADYFVLRLDTDPAARPRLTGPR